MDTARFKMEAHFQKSADFIECALKEDGKLSHICKSINMLISYAFTL